MIAGLLGMLAALVIFVLALFTGRRIDPKIAGPFNQFMTKSGFTPLKPSDPVYKETKDAARLTRYIGYVEQIYRRAQDDCTLCWTLDAEDTNHRLIALLRQSQPSKLWILCLLPDLSGSRNIIRKTFALSLAGSGFQRVEMADLGPLADQADLLPKTLRHSRALAKARSIVWHSAETSCSAQPAPLYCWKGFRSITKDSSKRRASSCGCNGS
ncbi:hypothetical protein GWK36_05405 [Caldichromatium japonicum]|uniref:Uncharacterized protein n=1 Tax=Caldichromatium japonicum TaxID=2699430 RepID=A0A6G7VCJ2_9GAMM|nr:hypothetical protein [Caldichromatium japonicum]QIK37507.1 hypothetical protein GWK36_05405 [Caldichromatium japonicum]